MSKRKEIVGQLGRPPPPPKSLKWAQMRTPERWHQKWAVQTPESELKAGVDSFFDQLELESEPKSTFFGQLIAPLPLKLFIAWEDAIWGPCITLHRYGTQMVNTMCWNKAAEGGLGWVLDTPFSMWQWLRWYSEAFLSAHLVSKNQWGSEYHLNHCHLEKGGSKTHPRPFPAALFQHIVLTTAISRYPDFKKLMSSTWRTSGGKNW